MLKCYLGQIEFSWKSQLAGVENEAEIPRGRGRAAARKCVKIAPFTRRFNFSYGVLCYVSSLSKCYLKVTFLGDKVPE